MQTSRLISSRADCATRQSQTRAIWVTACTLISIPVLVGSGALADRPAAPFTTPADRTLEEIVVTGTRLRIIGIESSASVTVLSRRDIERGGTDSIGKVLQTLPAITGSQLNTNVNAGGGMEPSPSGGGSGDGSVRVAAAQQPVGSLAHRNH